ncbi:hypothetical protein D3C86_1761810 [compost metagenome]
MNVRRLARRNASTSPSGTAGGADAEVKRPARFSRGSGTPNISSRTIRPGRPIDISVVCQGARVPSKGRARGWALK